MNIDSNQKNYQQANRLTWGLTLLAGMLMTAYSGISVAFSERIYPDPLLAESFLANDLVNLILGLPFFIYVLFLLRRGSFLGSLLLPGALVYVIYNYFAYVVGQPLGLFTFLNLALVLISSAALFSWLRSVDLNLIKGRLAGSVPRRITGWILTFFGALFFLLAVNQIVSSQIGTAQLTPGEQATSLADLLVSSLWMAGGILLLRDHALGYASGLGLLITASSLFAGLILFFFLAPWISGRPFDWIEVITVMGMSLIAIVPTVLFWRGAARHTR